LRALVVEPTEVLAVAEDIARAELCAFDLEFLAQDRLVPTLCLIQIAHGALDARSEPTVSLVDPMATDAGPVIRAIAAHACPVAHAPRQDLQILAAAFGVSVPRIRDTQVMAAFAGLGDQLGLATVARETIGRSLGKEQQWTDWARRPLSDAQLAYAADDVRYLPAIHARLVERLGARLPWACEESAVIGAEAEAAARVTAATAWEQLGGTRGIDAETLSAVIALAAWRWETAHATDKPLGWVLGEKQILELAKTRPLAAAGVRALKGLPVIAKERAAEIAEVIAARQPAEAPVRPSTRAPGARAQRWAEQLLAIVQLVAESTGVAARLLATRADAEAFARTVDEGAPTDALPAMSTWRRALLGETWLDWLAGRLALAGDPTSAQGVKLVKAL
jgi:ribonuclease D